MLRDGLKQVGRARLTGLLAMLAVVVNAPAAIAQSDAAGSQTAAAERPAAVLLAQADPSGKPAVVRYSQRTRGANSAGANAANAPSEALATVCTAGCNQPPGTVIHVQTQQQPASLLADASMISPNQAAPDARCVAACDDSSSTRGDGPYSVDATYRSNGGVAEGGTRTQSGDWMVRINRDRSSPERR